MKASMRRAISLLSATTMALLALMACSGGVSKEGPKGPPLPGGDKALPPGESRGGELNLSLSFRGGEGGATAPGEI